MPSAYTKSKNAQERRLNTKHRRLVKERDGYRCVLTGIPEDIENGVVLEVHHVLGRKGYLKFWCNGQELWNRLVELKKVLCLETDDDTEAHLNELAKANGITWGKKQ